MAVVPRVNEVLGIDDDESTTGMLSRLREGLPFEVIDNIREVLGLSVEQLAEALAISPRTLSRRKKRNALAPEESDRVYRIARVFAHGVDVFSDRDKAVRWFKQPHPSFDGVAPLEVFDTDLGTQMVDDELTRIEFGVYR